MSENRSRTLHEIAKNQALSSFDERLLDIAFNATRLSELKHVTENTKSISVQNFALYQLTKFGTDPKWKE